MDFSDKERLSEQIEDLGAYMQSLGQHKLARNIWHEKFLSRIVDSSLLAQRWEFESSFLDQREREIQETLISFQSKTFDKIQTYNNFIITLGYAGFFAIWSFVDSSLAEFDRILIACLLGFSLLVFIFSTLSQGFKLASLSRKASSVLMVDYEDRQELIDAWKKYEATTQKQALKSQKAYPFIFFGSAGTGFTAGVMLIAILFFKVIGFPFSFEQIFSRIGQFF